MRGGYSGKRRCSAPVALILAALCAALGLAFTVLYTPMRCSGYLLFCGAAFFAAWHFLWKNRARKAVRVVLCMLLVLVIAGGAVFTVLEAKVIAYGRTDTTDDVSAVVVLGAGVKGTTPSLSLRSRLEAALTYVEDKPGIPILVTGSRGPGEDISEARCMADWLMAHGIEKDRILLEEQADNTEENIRYAKEMLKRNGVDLTDDIAVVSADYHLYRASLYWGAPNMTPVAAHMPAAYWPLTVNYYVREAFAVAKLKWL